MGKLFNYPANEIDVRSDTENTLFFQEPFVCHINSVFENSSDAMTQASTRVKQD